ncbi:phage tail assembly chaperone [Methylobacterium fujisawaense]|uniref:phage tail assembly chaperone n=1 Tax=Methylobacterium fujisawaense TaxID=107400 RepID=UPI003CEBAD7C
MISDQDRLRIPTEAEHVWAWFWDLERGRRAGFSPEPFAYADIAAWARLCGEELRPWEVRALMAMDGARRGEHRRLTDPAQAGRVQASDTAGMMQLMQLLSARE